MGPLKTIWLRRGYEVAKYREQAAMWVAWHTPRWLVRWCVIRAWGYAWHMVGNKEPDELTCKEVYDACDGC